MVFRNPVNKITLPDGARTGEHRFVIGADTPPELRSFGIDEALLAYITDINIVTDPFTRTVSNGWGQEPYTDEFYAVSGGAVSDYSTNGTQAVHSNGTINVERTSMLNIGSTDAKLTIDTVIPVVPTGSVIRVRVGVRATNTSNFYFAQLEIDTAGTARLNLQRRVGGTNTTIVANVVAGTHAAGNRWRISVEAYGTALEASAQNETAGSATVTISGTDSNITTGRNVIVLSVLGVGLTNPLPVDITFDDLFVAGDTNHTGPEVGYFWIGSSNRFDGAGDGRVLAYGNVTYPTVGVPSSATMSDVKTNFQQNMHSQYPQTIFKDHTVTYWSAISLEKSNGFSTIRYEGRDLRLMFHEETQSANADTDLAGASYVAVPGATITVNMPVANCNWSAWGTFDMGHTTAGAGDIGLGALFVDGVQASGANVAVFAGNANTGGMRLTVGQHWQGTVATAGNHTFDLRVQKAGGTDNHIRCRQTHTRIKLQASVTPS